jgi:hypothetical protein
MMRQREVSAEEERNTHDCSIFSLHMYTYSLTENDQGRINMGAFGAYDTPPYSTSLKRHYQSSTFITCLTLMVH